MLPFLLMAMTPEDSDKILYLYKTYHTSMIKLAKSKLKDGGVCNYDIDAQDIVQEAFYKLCKSINRIDLSRPESDIKAYVLASVINVINDYFSKEVHYDTYDFASDIQDSEDYFIEQMNIHNRYNEVLSMIERLEAIYQVVFIFRFLQNRSVDEVAQIVGISKKAVESRIQRGRKKLVEMLKEDRK